MQQDNAELLKNKEVEVAQALKLQKSVDELKMLSQKKDDQIARLQAEAVGAKKEHDKDLSALLSEKDSVYNQLSLMQQDYTELLKSKKVLTQKKDHEIVIWGAEAVGAKKKVQKMHSLVKEKDDEIQRLKGWQAESIKEHYKDISETHKRSRSGDPAVAVRDKLKITNLRQTVEEDYMSETKTVEKDGREETTQKRRRASSTSDDDEKSGSNGDDDEQIGSDEDGEMQSGSDEDGEKQSRSDEDGVEQSGSGDDGNEEQSGSDEETTYNKHKRQRGVPPPPGQLPSESPSASAAAGLIKVEEVEEQLNWEGVRLSC